MLKPILIICHMNSLNHYDNQSREQSFFEVCLTKQMMETHTLSFNLDKVKRKDRKRPHAALCFFPQLWLYEEENRLPSSAEAAFSSCMPTGRGHQMGPLHWSVVGVCFSWLTNVNVGHSFYKSMGITECTYKLYKVYMVKNNFKEINFYTVKFHILDPR